MSLGIVVKAPEGIVIAAESRVTLELRQISGGAPLAVHNHFDNATKIFDLRGLNDYVGVVTYGMAVIGIRPAHSFLPELEAELKGKEGYRGPGEPRRDIADVAHDISAFYMKQWNDALPSDYAGPNMTFIVAGFNENEPYGRVYLVEIPRKPVPEERSLGQDFGLTWGGQQEIVHRLLRGIDPRLLDYLQGKPDVPDSVKKELMEQLLPALQLQVPFGVLALQDCVDLALFFIRATIQAQALTVGVRGCGGPIDLATITRRGGLTYVQRKSVHGETVEDPVAEFAREFKWLSQSGKP